MAKRKPSVKAEPKDIKESGFVRLEKFSKSYEKSIQLSLTIFTALVFFVTASLAWDSHTNIDLTKKEILKEPDFDIDFTLDYGLETQKEICTDAKQDFKGKLVLTNTGYRDVYFNKPGKIMQECPGYPPLQIGGISIIGQFLYIATPIEVEYTIPPRGIKIDKCDFVFELMSSGNKIVREVIPDVNAKVCMGG